MAKKKESMSVEDRLAAALVPEEEWPYEIPENWVWTTMQTIAKWGSGGTPSRKNPGFYGGSVPWIKTGELTDDYIFETEETITEEGVKSSSAKWFPAHTIIIAMYGATIGKTGIMGIPSTTNQACACGIATSSVDYKYLFYYARSEKTALLKKSKGGAQPNISQDIIKTHCFPLPPLPEQHRIVNQIESSFVKLDEIAEEAQAVIDGYEHRKAAILHRAFTGELTEEWRQLHGFPDSVWQTKRFDEIAEVKSNLVDPSNYMDYPHIAPDNIEKKTGRLLDYHTVEEDGVKSGKHLFFAGQILYSKIRPYLSKVVIADFDGLCSADMYPVEPKDNIDTRFLWYFMLSDDFLEQASTAGSRSVLPKINQKELGRIQMRVTELVEQHEIVRRLDTLLAAEATTKAAAEATLENITTLRQSILARAFRGELGTNDPNEEPAIELLKRTISTQ